MKSIINGLLIRNLVVVAVFVCAASGTALAQYSQSYQINAIQQQVRSKVLNDNRGFLEAVEFDNNARVISPNFGRINRVVGTGRYRSNLSDWRTFTYEGQFNSRTGEITNVIYRWGTEIINPPQEDGNIEMTWNGRVDGTARLTIRGGRIIAREVQTQVPLSEITSHVSRELPDRPVNVTVLKREGRGLVRVIQQPDSSNDFTAVVEIRDPEGGSDYYRLEINWAGGGIIRPPIGQRPGRREMYWEGNVDGVIEVYVQDRSSHYEVINGRDPTDVREDFNARLPRRDVEVTVRKTEGRGTVEVIRQPNRLNGYTAVIRITDRRGGRARYGFELNWNRFAGNEGNDEGNNNITLTWSGRVDDVVRLGIQGRYVRGYTISGQPLSNYQFNFNESLPEQDVTVRVYKREGRGDVWVIQQPNRSNNYIAVIEIRDPSGGADNYRLDFSW